MWDTKEDMRYGVEWKILQIIEKFHSISHNALELVAHAFSLLKHFVLYIEWFRD